MWTVTLYKSFRTFVIYLRDISTMTTPAATNTITREHARDLKRFTGVVGASNVIFVAVPRCKGSPWAEDSLYMGNYDPNAPYWALADAALMMATIASDTDEGGFLLKVDESQPELYAKVKKAVAAKGLYPYGSPEEAARKSLENRHAYKNAFFNPGLSDEILSERYKILEYRKANMAKEDVAVLKKERDVRCFTARQRRCSCSVPIGRVHAVCCKIKRGFHPELERDGLTDEESATGQASLDPEDEIDRGSIRVDELADVGQRAAGNVPLPRCSPSGLWPESRCPARAEMVTTTRWMKAT